MLAAAGIENGHAHRFRDTFAVELLLAGVAMERVSVMLGHSSLRITENIMRPGYAPARNKWKRIYAVLGRVIR